MGIYENWLAVSRLRAFTRGFGLLPGFFLTLIHGSCANQFMHFFCQYFSTWVHRNYVLGRSTIIAFFAFPSLAVATVVRMISMDTSVAR